MSCELSPSAAAFSTMLSAFVGSVINGLCSGWLIAFITGWISWLSVLRILAAGLFELHLTIKAGANFKAANTEYESIEMNGVNANDDAMPETTVESQPNAVEDAELHRNGLRDPAQTAPADDLPHLLTTSNKAASFGARPSPRVLLHMDQTVTAFGWLGWTWSAIYTPISQTIWLCVHITSSDGIHQFVRALAIGVSALGLTFDYKQRYAAALGQRWGAWAFVTFNVWNCTACLLLGVEAMVLLIHGVINMDNVPIPLVIAYPIFSIVWAAGSWAFLPPIDGARSGNVFAGVLMGAFAGLFVAAPAFALWRNAKFDDDVADMLGHSAPEGLGLGDFLACQGASVWVKFAAIMP